MNGFPGGPLFEHLDVAGARRRLNERRIAVAPREGGGCDVPRRAGDQGPRGKQQSYSGKRNG